MRSVRATEVGDELSPFSELAISNFETVCKKELQGRANRFFDMTFRLYWNNFSSGAKYILAFAKVLGSEAK